MKPTHIKDLLPDPENRRRRTPRGHAMIVESLQTVGAARSIVIDERNTILAGSGTIEGAAEAGITKLKIVEADGHEIVAVRRRGLSEEQKRQLAIYDNRTSELAEWSAEQMRFDVEQGLSFARWFTDDELEAVLTLPPEEHDGLTDPDAVPEARATDIRAGDLFQLGAHVLLCGDATRKGDVVRLLARTCPRLMVTDPPYGVEYDPAWRDRVLQDGAKRRTDAVPNDQRADWREAWALFPGDIAYVWHDWMQPEATRGPLAACGFDLRTHLVWKKRRPVFSRGHYHGQHEVCWYAVRKGASARWCGDRSQSTVWEIDALAGSDESATHATQKPVECYTRPMRNHKAPEVFDPFVGTGTAIIAAEKIGRACYAIEIAPVFVQMAIDRWTAFTGQQAIKVGEAIV